jgi:hypothetical protein
MEGCQYALRRLQQLHRQQVSGPAARPGMDGENQPPAVVVPELGGDDEVGDVDASVAGRADGAVQYQAVEPEFVRAVLDGAEPHTQQCRPGFGVGKGVGEPADRTAPVDALPACGPGGLAGEGVVGLGLLRAQDFFEGVVRDLAGGAQPPIGERRGNGLRLSPNRRGCRRPAGRRRSCAGCRAAPTDRGG